MALGLNKRRPYAILTSGFQLTQEEREIYLAELQAECDRTVAAQEAVSWLSGQRAEGESALLDVQMGFRQFDAIMARPHLHIVELYRELVALHGSMQRQFDLQKSTAMRLALARKRWDAVEPSSLKSSYFDLLLSRLEAQAESGYQIDGDKLLQLEAALSKAEGDAAAPFEDESARIRNLALALIERQKDQMTVAQSEKIQRALNSLGEATSRREMWNLLRESERSGHSPLVLAAIAQTSSGPRIGLDDIVKRWKSLAEGPREIASTAPETVNDPATTPRPSAGKQRKPKKKGSA